MTVIFWLLAVAVTILGAMSIIKNVKSNLKLAVCLFYVLCSIVYWYICFKRDVYNLTMIIVLVGICIGFFVTKFVTKFDTLWVTLVMMMIMVIFIIECTVSSITFSARMKDINTLMLSDKSEYLLRNAKSFDKVKFKIRATAIDVIEVNPDTEYCKVPISDVAFHTVDDSYIIAHKGILYETDSNDFYRTLEKKDSELSYILTIEYSTEEKYYTKCNSKLKDTGYNTYIYTDCSLDTNIEQ